MKLDRLVFLVNHSSATKIIFQEIPAVTCLTKLNGKKS